LATDSNKQAEPIKQLLSELFKTQRLAVLATQRAEHPYASLVAFAADKDLRRIYFATPRSTRKFENLSANPHVALLISSSSNDPSDFHRAVAVTVQGRVEPIPENFREEKQQRYLHKHPYLADFVKSPTCAFLCVHVHAYYLVKNFQHVMEYHFEQDMA
jgi:nitroimidazol reductase NimA-like FMN-containing flavoprotein (pyridoxamine 5'-phosphate oxidase superfamily)